MTAFTIVQAVVITAVVLFSAVQAFRKLAPKTAKRLQSRMSGTLDTPGRSIPLRRFGAWLQPAEAKAGACGSGDGCSSCSGCAPVASGITTGNPDVHPLNFRPRDK